MSLGETSNHLAKAQRQPRGVDMLSILSLIMRERRNTFSQGYRTQFAHLAAAVTTAWLSVKFNLLQIKVCLGTEVRAIFETSQSYTTDPKLFILFLNRPS